MKKPALSLDLIFMVAFVRFGIWRYTATGNIFYLFNFTYIGGAISVGMYLGDVLPREKKALGRKITQLLVGIYMLLFLGFFGHENMQIEGFFIYLMLGVFQAAVLHYAVAKIFGPFLFGRAWCGYACWTAMILDFLPYKIPQGKRAKGWGYLRYIHFIASLILALYIWFIVAGGKWQEGGLIEWQLFLVGNIFYYVIGISLAFWLKDNRAFCKYLCPIPTVQKIGARFALMKVSIDEESCIDCQLCEKNCPMNIRLLTYKNKGQRVLSTECILCATCVHVCPKQAIHITTKLDCGFKEEINN